MRHICLHQKRVVVVAAVEEEAVAAFHVQKMDWMEFRVLQWLHFEREVERLSL
jgi:hypothetical protein